MRPPFLASRRPGPAHASQPMTPPVQQGCRRIGIALERRRRRAAQAHRRAFAGDGQGDRRRGHEVFYSSQAACSSCHRLGYTGGNIGPELSHIGRNPHRAQLARVDPVSSLSFVHSFEPVLVVTVDGRAVNGVIRKTRQDKATCWPPAPDQEAGLPRGRRGQSSRARRRLCPRASTSCSACQQLTDLVAFLKNAD